MLKRTKIPIINKEQIFNKYLNGATAQEIAVDYNCTKYTVINFLKRFNIPIRDHKAIFALRREKGEKIGRIHISPKLRFENQYIIKDNGCWEWNGFVDRFGYGIFAEYNSKGKFTLWRVHRFSYTIYRKPIKLNEVIHHICHNKICVNPEHLETLDTHKHNEKHPHNGVPKKTHCLRGHELSVKNTYIYSYGRSCKLCCAIRNQERKNRQKY